ncbi:MAG TPA: hypothetical protein PKL52_00575 [Tenuifilaceae bacterium]|nr:hypothetical protein [Tenuifilaceae bacterium]
METKSTISRNPLVYQNQKQKTLDEAKKLFMKYLKEFAQYKNLSENEIMLIKEFFEEVYLEKKATYILEEKLRELNQYLNLAFNFALSSINRKQSVPEDLTKVFYYKNKKGELIYERH